MHLKEQMLSGLRKAFKESIEDYLETYRNKGIEPEKPCKENNTFKLGQMLEHAFYSGFILESLSTKEYNEIVGKLCPHVFLGIHFALKRDFLSTIRKLCDNRAYHNTLCLKYIREKIINKDARLKKEWDEKIAPLFEDTLIKDIQDNVNKRVVHYDLDEYELPKNITFAHVVSKFIHPVIEWLNSKRLTEIEINKEIIESEVIDLFKKLK